MWYNGFLDLSAWQLVAVTLLMKKTATRIITMQPDKTSRPFR